MGDTSLTHSTIRGINYPVSQFGSTVGNNIYQFFERLKVDYGRLNGRVKNIPLSICLQQHGGN